MLLLVEEAVDNVAKGFVVALFTPQPFVRLFFETNCFTRHLCVCVFLLCVYIGLWLRDVVLLSGRERGSVLAVYSFNTVVKRPKEEVDTDVKPAHVENPSEYLRL